MDYNEEELLLAPINFLNFDTDIHVIPNDDSIPHASDINCPCGPTTDSENLRDIKNGLAISMIWVHTCVSKEKNKLH
jgi:hypothetical protein